jgi:hypothetical protein
MSEQFEVMADGQNQDSLAFPGPLYGYTGPKPDWMGFTGFSGSSSAPTASSGVEGFSAFDPLTAELIPLNHRDLRKLGQLIREEKETRERFETAVKRRDRFCVELEQKHSLTGLTWVVDSHRGGLVITGKRSSGLDH